MRTDKLWAVGDLVPPLDAEPVLDHEERRKGDARGLLKVFCAQYPALGVRCGLPGQP